MLLTPAQITPEVFETREKGFFFFFFLPGVSGCVSCLRACLGVRLLPQSYQYGTGLSEGADRVSGGQLRGDKRVSPNSKHWVTTSFLPATALPY